MANKPWWSRLLRLIGTILMGLTAALTILSGAGTTCIALAAESFGEKWLPYVPYRWLYIIFVLATLAIGVMGVRAVVLLARGKPGASRAVITALVAGVLVGVIHMAVSRSLRGSSMPVDPVVFTTVFTLIVFLIFRIPPIWKGLNAGRWKDDDSLSGGAAAIVIGILVLTIQVWMGPTHTWGGVNYADAWHNTLLAIGSALVLTGLGLAVSSLVKPKEETVRSLA